MPFFDFKCDDCGKELNDFMVGYHEENPTCPEKECKSNKMRKLIPTGTTFSPSPAMYSSR